RTGDARNDVEAHARVLQRRGFAAVDRGAAAVEHLQPLVDSPFAAHARLAGTHLDIRTLRAQPSAHGDFTARSVERAVEANRNLEPPGGLVDGFERAAQ